MSNMVVSRCRDIGPPSSCIVLGTLFLLAADLRRHARVGEIPQGAYANLAKVRVRVRVNLTFEPKKRRSSFVAVLAVCVWGGCPFL